MLRTLALALALAAANAASAAPNDDSQMRADEALLRKAGWATADDKLLEPLRALTLSATQCESAKAALEELDAERYHLRERATRRLIELGPGVIPLLQPAQLDLSLERRRRAERCLAELEPRVDAAALEAVVRLAKARRVRGALATLEAALPCTGDGALKDEIASAIAALTPGASGKADPSPTLQARQAAERFLRTLNTGSLKELRSTVGEFFFLQGSITLDSAAEMDEFFTQVLAERDKNGRKWTWRDLHVLRPEPKSSPLDGCTAPCPAQLRIVVLRARLGNADEESAALFIDLSASKARVIGLGQPSSAH